MKSEGLFRLFCFTGIWWYIASLVEFGNLLQNAHFKVVVDGYEISYLLIFNYCSVKEIIQETMKVVWLRQEEARLEKPETHIQKVAF